MVIISKNKKISISVVISLLTLIASFLTSFIFTKFLLNQPQIGDENYGLKSTVDSFISFASIFTFGMSSTFVRFHKKYFSKEKEVISTFNLITTIISILVVLFGVVLCILTVNNLIIDPSKGMYSKQQVHDFLLILIISISFTCLSIILGNSKWFLESEKHVVFVRLVNLIVVIAYPIISTIFVLMGANMVVVTLIYSIVYLIGFLAYLFFRIRKTKTISFFSYKYFDKQIMKEIIIFSIFVILTSCVETFNHSVDKLILTLSFSASLTTLYQLSLTLNQVLLSLSDIIYAPYMPYLAEDITNNNQENVQKTFNHVTFILIFIAFFILSGFVGCGKEFIHLWLGAERELVYYFVIILFSTWPLYGMVKFSILLHRLSNKHFISALLFVISFILHLIITFSLIRVIGVWACICGTAFSSLVLGITFIFYNKNKLQISQKEYLINLLKMGICSIVSIGMILLISFWFRDAFSNTNLVLTMLIKGAITVLIFFVVFAICYFKKIIFQIKITFSDEFSISNIGKESRVTRLKNKLSKNKDFINRLFPYVFIVYFALNFASYYLGGLSFLKNVVDSSPFTYGTKFVSYLVLISYSIVFVLGNNIKLSKTNIILFTIMFSLSIISSILVPKHVSFISKNEYRWTVKTTLSIGFFDLMIGNLNYLIDLFALFLYLYVFRKEIKRRHLLPFLRFVVVFACIECLYTFIFQYKDYFYYFTKAIDNSSFNGYSTNISGTFSSKNGLGFILFQSIVACVFLMKFEPKHKHLYIAPIILLNIVNILSLCKTSAISSIVFETFVFLSFVRGLWDKQRRAFWIYLISFLIATSVVVMFITPVFNNVGFLGSISKKIHEIFFVSGDATIRSRIILWEYAIKLLKGPYMIFGYGKIVSTNFLNISSNFITHTFHSGVLDILCSFGVFGVLLYFYGIVYSFKESNRFECDKLIKSLILAVIISTLLYGLMESVYLLMSSSSTMLVSNLILASSSNNYKRIENKEVYYAQICI